MNNNEAELIFVAFDNITFKGKGLLALSTETGIGYTRLKEIVQFHKEYFTRVGISPNYRINPFGIYRGKTELMLKAIEKRNQESKTLYLGLFIIWFVVFIPSIISTTNSNRNIFEIIARIINS